MALALEEARSCFETGDVPVGAVVVSSTGAVLGVGRNARELLGDPSAHAEVLALRAAAERLGHWRLDGCTLYVTLEPCAMCAGAIVGARIQRLVFGASEPKTGAVGSLWDLVRDRRLVHQVEVLPGVMAEESAEMLSGFFEKLRD